MGEHLAEQLFRAADFLRYVGKHTESNALVMTARLARELHLDTEEKFAAYVEAIEGRAVPSESTSHE